MPDDHTAQRRRDVTLKTLLGGIASILLLTAPAAAEAPGAMLGEQTPSGVQAPSAAQPWRNQGAWSLIGVMLGRRSELELSPAQVGGLAVAAAASAPSPTAQVKQAVDRALHVLRDQALKPESKQAERRRLLWTIADGIFDFEEMSRRALGPHWRPLTENQRGEFVRLFADVLERAYMLKIEAYSDEKMLYRGERVEDDYATVSTRIVTKEGAEIPIDYRLLKRNDRWLAYDVNIEGVSLVANYRTQFNTVIRTSSYDELLKRLRSRAEELKAPR